jgi:uncharacterized membrane protein YqaE (UPF0057 family)
MLYFKKYTLHNETEKKKLEESLRRSASKRNFPLDFIPATVGLDSDKTFLGFENKKGIQFTRLRSSFERALPKLIIYLPKNVNTNYYQIRFSWTTLIVFAFIAFIFPLLVVGVIKGSEDRQAMLGISLFCLAYPFWTLAELHFIKCKMDEAMTK